MTATKRGLGGRLQDTFSAASMASGLVNLVYGLTFVGKVAIGLAGVAALGIADTYIGGTVLTDALGDKFMHVSWATSIGTSAITLAMMGYAMAKKGIALLWLIPALFISVPDVIVDARFPTLVLYGHDVAMTSGIYPPDPSFMWLVLEILFTAITVVGEAGIALIFSWLFMVIRDAKGEAAAKVSGALPQATGYPVAV